MLVVAVPVVTVIHNSNHSRLIDTNKLRRITKSCRTSSSSCYYRYNCYRQLIVATASYWISSKSNSIIRINASLTGLRNSPYTGCCFHSFVNPPSSFSSSDSSTSTCGCGSRRIGIWSSSFVTNKDNSVLTKMKISETTPSVSSVSSSLLSSILEKNNGIGNGANTANRGSNSGHVVVVGSANYDMTVYTSTIPKLGETVLGQDFITSCGGKGANQAIAAASVQQQNPFSRTVSMICRVGTNDVFGTTLLQNFRKKEVYVNESKCKDQMTIISTGVACITVDIGTGDNCIIVAPGANSKLRPEDVRDELLQLHQHQQQKQQTINSSSSSSSSTIRSAPPSVLLVQLEIPYETALEALRIGKEVLGCITILNPAPAPTDVSLLDKFYQYTDIIIPNQSELCALITGTMDDTDDTDEVAMAQILLKKGIKVAVIATLGERGALIVTKKSTIKKDGTTDTDTNIITDIDDNNDYTTCCVSYCTEPIDLPCREEPVLDTIGAGDAFCGALASYISSGIYDLEKAVTLSCGYASMSVRRKGADYPTYDELPICLKIPAQTPPFIETNENNKNNEEQQKIDTTVKPKLTFVTGNKNKLAEVQKILMSEGGGNDDTMTMFPYEIINQKIDVPELQGNDTIEIAIEKCKVASQYVSGPCFTEDTSLCFNALNGMPGPYIKWFLEKCGHQGLNQLLDGFPDRTAYAQTVVAYTPGRRTSTTTGNTNTKTPNDENDDIIVHVFEGRTDGRIVLPRGPTDFGWDPIFEPMEGNGLTYAEMTKDAKNQISHRGRAFTKLRQFLQSEYDKKI